MQNHILQPSKWISSFWVSWYWRGAYSSKQETKNVSSFSDSLLQVANANSGYLKPFSDKKIQRILSYIFFKKTKMRNVFIFYLTLSKMHWHHCQLEIDQRHVDPGHSDLVRRINWISCKYKRKLDAQYLKLVENYTDTQNKPIN